MKDVKHTVHIWVITSTAKKSFTNFINRQDLGFTLTKKLQFEPA